MMTVNALTPSTAAASATGTAKNSLSDLTQGDFLNLMTTQMQQQDPFNPMDQNAMLAQMAQFSSLAGIGDINQTLQAIAAKLDAITAAQNISTAA